jgi:predicted metalloprotease with PDZ domain
MTKFFFVIALVCFTVYSLSAQEILYTLSMPRPQNHYFEVEMDVKNLNETNFDVKMPVWAPGSYLVREFSKNVNLVKAFNSKGESLPVTKKSKNAWTITKGKNEDVKIKYEVYAFELSVRTSFLDLSHGFVSGSGVFMYIENLKNTPGKLDILPYKDFKKISTSLPKAAEGMSGDGKQRFQFATYDELADCPIEIGNQTEFEFKAAGVNHSVAIYGAGNYDVATLKKDMAKIVETATAVFGENPNKNYTFIIHNVVNGQGGLEHTNSTTLSVNRWTYQGSAYMDFLSLVAHEYFHLWNVKRIRPIELGPFNYDEENYTSLLWVMEGFTSYYDELLLRRAGYYSEDTYISKLQSSLNYVEGSVGTRIQPVAHASFDAWIKAYKPTENSANTSMTYYTRGALLAALMDAQIIAKFNGTKCLDHFLQALYTDFYKKQNRGFSEAEFEKAFSAFMQEDMSGFFKNYVYETKVPDYKTVFEKIGVSITYTGASKPNFGASFSQAGGKVVVKAIRAESAAEFAGLSVNDEVIGLNGYRISQTDLESMLNGMSAGDEINLLISRDDVLLELKGKMGSYEKPSYKISLQTSGKNLNLQTYWLRVI